MYKTLSKVTKARNTIPALSMVMVKDGVATTTNMDLMIQAPCALKDGMYHGHCFDKSIHILDDDMSVDDMPIIEVKGEKRGEFVIDALDIDDLKWVSTAMSVDETRYYLNGVYADEAGLLVATDGHRLHIMDKEMTWFNYVPCIMHKGFIKLFLELFKELKADSATFEVYDSKVIVKIGDHTITGKLVDGTYPDFRKVIPQDDGITAKTPFVASEVAKVLPEVTALMKSYTGSKIPHMKFNADGTAHANVEGYTKNMPKYDFSFKPTVDCGYNAKYMACLCDGLAEVREKGKQPLVVHENRGRNKKTGVLMPLRF